METIKVERNGQYFILSNLTTQHALELKTNSQELSKYFNHCIKSGSNVCSLGYANAGSTSTNVPSPSANATSALPTPTAIKKRKFLFLCGSYEKQNYIYGVKFDNHPWHYFEEMDSVSAQHGSLPASFDSSITGLHRVETISVDLDEAQWINYYKNDTFVFKEKKLNTYLTIDGKKPVRNEKSEKIEKSTKDLIFIAGQTNPLFFLNEFEKCSDVKSDKDKMYRILDFVDECDKGEFTKLYFTSDWGTVKSDFLKLYTLSFVQNKKKSLKIDFAEVTTLRTFFELQLKSFSDFTTLPFVNQIEMILNELPDEISSLFIVDEKMTCNKNEILNYCDAIQDLFEAIIIRPNEHEIQDPGQPSDASDRMIMEVFNYTPDSQSLPPKPSRGGGGRGGVGRGGGRGRGTGKGSIRGGRITKRGSLNNSKSKSTMQDRNGFDKTLDSIMEVESEENELSDDLDFLQQMDNTSKSSWSE